MFRVYEVYCGDRFIGNYKDLSADGAINQAYMKTGSASKLSRQHISEPTRLRRISYAVFVVKKKKKKTKKQTDASGTVAETTSA